MAVPTAILAARSPAPDLGHQQMGRAAPAAAAVTATTAPTPSHSQAVPRGAAISALSGGGWPSLLRVWVLLWPREEVRFDAVLCCAVGPAKVTGLKRVEVDLECADGVSCGLVIVMGWGDGDGDDDEVQGHVR